jgi:hypothetical protein
MFQRHSAAFFPILVRTSMAFAGSDGYTPEDPNLETPAVNPQVQTPPKPGTQPPAMPPKPGIERAEFPLPEGVARLEFPAALSTASYEDMEAWLELVLRRAKRSVKDEATN